MNIKGVRKTCAHCGSSELQYYGQTLGYFHYYYKCSNCQKYTEHYYPLRTQVTINAVWLLLFVVFGLLVLNSNSPKTGILYFSAIAVLTWTIFYKCRRAFIKVIPIDRLPDDRAILRPANRTLRLLLIAIFVIFAIGLAIYASIFYLNLSRQ